MNHASWQNNYYNVQLENTMDEIELSDTAKKILACFEFRARDTYTAIAKQVGLSEQLVKYHIHRAKEQGFISEMNPVFDPAVLGHSLYIIYIRLLGVTTAQEESWLKKCMTIPGIMVTAQSFGRWNGLVAIWARNPEVLDNIIAELVEPIAGKIAEMQVTTRLYSYYGSTQILDKKLQKIARSSDMVMKPHILEKKDELILSLLSRNARLSASAIAEEVSLSPTAVNNRILALENKGVILGYRAIYRYGLMGYSQFRVLLRLANPSNAICNRIMKEAFASGKVIMVSRHLGFSDLDIRCFTRSQKELASFVADLRDKFVKDGIVQVEIIPLLAWGYINHIPLQS